MLEGTTIPFSTVFVVLRLTPIASASTAWSAAGPVERLFPGYNRMRTDRLVTEAVFSVEM